MDSHSTHFDLALNYVNSTDKNVFLTGKAGTGKTTFLRHVTENAIKKLVVVAPTGVAAMNAGGVTIHSLFQLPLGSFVPERNERIGETQAIYDQRSLIQHLKLNSAKRDMIRELELLVIDEVSMLRADLLDAIDTVLKHIRRNPLPFGGVQLLLIGDLFQLPPVVKNFEWQVLQNYYPGPSFFHAHALAEEPPVYIELKTIYRQSDEEFIRILNNIRNNEVDERDITQLHERYIPDFKPGKNGEYITLTSHNAKAGVINRQELDKLEGKTYRFAADISGDFNEESVNAETELVLKEGAQVMFIRNDKQVPSRYYNGRIGIVQSIDNGEIKVGFPNTTEELVVEKETWQNIRYKLNNESGALEEEVKGKFVQYPIRLAWAITIHKSQGLTFEKAIIDAGASFAPGQVYVALSRLTLLDGLVLYSRISPNSISSDPAAIAYSENEQSEMTLKNDLKEAQAAFFNNLLIKAFEWDKITFAFARFLEELDAKKIPKKEDVRSLAQDWRMEIDILAETARKFRHELFGLIEKSEQNGYGPVYHRLEAAVNYFTNNIKQKIQQPLEQHLAQMKLKSGVKKYLKEVYGLTFTVQQLLYTLEESQLLCAGLRDGKALTSLMAEMSEIRNKRQAVIKTKAEKVKKEKKSKGDSHRTTLDLYKEGKTIREIAELRSLALTTIEGHLASFAGTELELEQLVEKDKINHIVRAIETTENSGLTPIKSKLGDNYSYMDIKCVVNYLKTQKAISK